MPIPMRPRKMMTSHHRRHFLINFLLQELWGLFGLAWKAKKTVRQSYGFNKCFWILSMGRWHRNKGRRILTSGGYILLSQVYKGVEWNFTKKLARKCPRGSEVGRTGRILKDGQKKAFQTQERVASVLIYNGSSQEIHLTHKIKKKERLEHIREDFECCQSSLDLIQHVLGTCWKF